MVDSEVERLRGLRASALRVRAISQALRNPDWPRSQSLLDRGGLAAWRIARTTSGRLRAHPFARYQRDASFLVLVRNCLSALGAGLAARTSTQALTRLSVELALLSREVGRARALTWSADLSDAFGRSQGELRGLLNELNAESDAPKESIPLASARLAASDGLVASDWPYLAL